MRKGLKQKGTMVARREVWQQETFSVPRSCRKEGFPGLARAMTRGQAPGFQLPKVQPHSLWDLFPHEMEMISCGLATTAKLFASGFPSFLHP